jgi:hypothetical protein
LITLADWMYSVDCVPAETLQDLKNFPGTWQTDICDMCVSLFLQAP